MDYNRLAELLFPHINTTPEEIEARYPKRSLPEGAKVTRMGPSPTGFMHLGNLYGALVDERLAHQSGGVFYLRIEDTDKKREVEGGVQTIIEAFSSFGLPFDEGATLDGDNGAYGPYRQSQRAEIYQTFVKSLVQRGMAYPCFCTEEELAAAHAQQEANKENFGYYGKYAVWRDRPMEDIEAELQKGTPYVVRFRSEGSIENKIRHEDLVKGKMEVTENDQDVVILKSDGIPTYHFAHVVDDHLMGTTVVVRGEEWLATLPVHLQLFRAMGWKAPKYAHTAQLMKIDPETGGKRKLSKRKDPELALTFYAQEGYPVPAVLEYLMTLLNSNFEEWRRANQDAPMNDFPFSTKKMSGSGALFDIESCATYPKTSSPAWMRKPYISTLRTGVRRTTRSSTPCLRATRRIPGRISPSAAAAKSRAKTLRSGRTPKAIWTSCSTSCLSRTTPCPSACPQRMPRRSLQTSRACLMRPIRRTASLKR